MADRTGAHFWTAEIRRLGQAAAVASGQDPDLDVLRGAADLAAQQGATLLELRARADLCRHGGSAADQVALRTLVDGLAPPGGMAEVDAARSLLAGSA